MEQIHSANAARLEKILDEIGWPGVSLVGEEGAEAAWLIAQHAISQPAFQRRCLRLLQKAVRDGDAPGRHEAYLTDRIRFNEGRPQVYGSIFDWNEAGELVPWRLEDPASVDDRRRQVGLGNLEEAIGEARRRAKAEGERPLGDFVTRQQAIDAWRRRTGWLTGVGASVSSSRGRGKATASGTNRR